MVEYVILVSIISIAAVAIIVVLGNQIESAFQGVLELIEANAPVEPPA